MGSARQARLLRRISRLNREHGLIDDGDRIMVACSGGKDSWAMLHLLEAYRRMVPFEFELVAMTLDQGHPGFEAHRLREHYERHGFEYRIEFENTHDVVQANTPPGKIYCSLCSRMRRGILHRVADELGANKIALGHHREDAIETVLMNMMFSGRIESMPPLLPPLPGEGSHAVIRPLLSCAEEELGAYAAEVEAPILPCDLCGSQPQARRQQVKRWIAELERDIPDVRANVFASLSNVQLSYPFDQVGAQTQSESSGAPFQSYAPSTTGRTVTSTKTSSDARRRLRIVSR